MRCWVERQSRLENTRFKNWQSRQGHRQKRVRQIFVSNFQSKWHFKKKPSCNIVDFILKTRRFNFDEFSISSDSDMARKSFQKKCEASHYAARYFLLWGKNVVLKCDILCTKYFALTKRSENKIHQLYYSQSFFLCSFLLSWHFQCKYDSFHFSVF